MLWPRHADVGPCPRGHASPDRPDKPNPNAYIESFNGRFRDEYLNEHWFTNLAHAQAIINAWRREYNEERPTKGLGGLTPAHYARQLMVNGLYSHRRTLNRPATERGGTSPLHLVLMDDS